MMITLGDGDNEGEGKRRRGRLEKLENREGGEREEEVLAVEAAATAFGCIVGSTSIQDRLGERQTLPLLPHQSHSSPLPLALSPQHWYNKQQCKLLGGSSLPVTSWRLCPKEQGYFSCVSCFSCVIFYLHGQHHKTIRGILISISSILYCYLPVTYILLKRLKYLRRKNYIVKRHTDRQDDRLHTT